jgi:CheY-like chemotaxis protein
MHPHDFCIVVAEDDNLLRYCTVHLLERQGYRVIEARDGQEALDLVEKCNDEVHLLLTNYNMPGVNGAELARRLKEKHEKLVVILISGMDHGMESAPDFEVLSKPYNEAVLATKIRNLLRRSLDENFVDG